MDCFKTYYEFLVSENEKYNLTSITNYNEVTIKHFEDSLALGKALDLSKVTTLVDVGTGAGFPGVPLKMAYPHLKVTLIEPTGKKCSFLNQLVLKCDLKDVIIVNDRAENCSSLRETFDVATSRAVGSLSMLLELCIPLLRVNGVLVAMKGPDFEEELKGITHALKCLRASVVRINPYELSSGMGKRTLITIRKNEVTSKEYPRPFATMKKKPL